MTLFRYLVYVMCISCVLPLPLLSQSVTTDHTKIAVFSDLHYLSSDLRDIGYKTQEISETTGKNIIASTEVLDITIAKLDSANVDVLLIAGDLSFEGEKQSHEELASKLKHLQDKGMKIYVIPGNHDINNKAAKGFRGNTSYATPSVSAQEFVNIYDLFGYNDAIYRDDNSLSYVNEIDDRTWLLALDVASYENDANRNIGKVSKEQEDWILSVLNKANEKNKKVIAMMHWSLLEHMPMQAKLMPTYLVSDADNLKTLLADNGVEVVFTGHFHANDINKSTSLKGNTIYDVATGALVSFPYVIRYGDLSANKINLKSDFIYQTPSFPKLQEDSKNVLTKIARERSIPFIKKLGFNFTPDNIQALSIFVAKYFVASMHGDESFDKDDIVQIQNVFLDEGFPVSDSWHDFDSENNIPDNQIVIPLSSFPPF